MTEPGGSRRHAGGLRAAVWRASALTLVLSAALHAQGDGWDGLLSVRWSLLTRRDAATADYQDLRARLQMTTPAAGAHAVRLHLDVADREGIEERFAGTDNPYQSRAQVHRAQVQVDGILGGRLRVGRHLLQVGSTGAWEADGEGHVHALSGWARWRRGSSLSASVQVRSSYGQRQVRSEQAHLSWSPLPRGGWRLAVRLADTWSPWRQAEQALLQVHGRLGRGWSVDAGTAASLFRWETSREPRWRAHVRPQLGLRLEHSPLVWEVLLEEQLDEFQHLRTRALAGLSWRL
ncbi:MAG: hypothetical protein AB1505_02585 [Candidatus Latescibacterota bacterium]